MYLFELVRDQWPWTIAIAISLWFFTAALLPPAGQRDDEATRRARAQRAREYQRLRRLWVKDKP